MSLMDGNESYGIDNISHEELAKLREERDRYYRELTRLRAEDYPAQVNDLQQMLKGAEAELARVRENYDAAVGEAEAQAAEVDRLAFILNECQKEQVRLRAQEEQWNADSLLFGQMSRELARLREENSDLAAVVKALEDVPAERDRLREEIIRQGDVFRAAEKSYEAELAKLREDALAVERALDKANGEITRLREENDRLKSMDLHSSCHKREDRLREELVAQTNRAVNLQDRLNVCNEERREQDRELARLREELEDAEMRERGLIGSNNIISAERDRLREQVKTFEDDLLSAEDILKENVRLREELAVEKTLVCDDVRDENARLREHHHQHHEGTDEW